MRLRDFQYLIALAEERHFARAAAACHVTQPTLSAQLKKLESTLGAPLFERTTKQVRLTHFGERTVAVAKELLGKIDQIRAYARTSTSAHVDPVRLGVMRTLNPYLLPWLYPALTLEHPELSIEISEAAPSLLMRQVQECAVDAVITVRTPITVALMSLPLFEEPLVLACSCDQSPSSSLPVTENELANHSHIVPESGLWLVTDDAVPKSNSLNGRSAITDGLSAISMETARKMVVARQGCALLPALSGACLGSGPRSVSVRPLAIPGMYRAIDLVWRRSYPRSSEVERIAELVQGIAPVQVRTARRDRT